MIQIEVKIYATNTASKASTRTQMYEYNEWTNDENNLVATASTICGVKTKLCKPMKNVAHHMHLC
jgi:hypothetical protein